MWRLLPLLLGIALPAHTADEPLTRAIELPRHAKRLRSAGVPPDEVREVIAVARGKGISVAETADVLDDGAQACEQNGRIENFGSFVHQKLDEGLRGRDLAQAIHEEHARRGMGKGGKGGKGKAPDAGEGHGGPPEPGEGHGGPPEDAGRDGKGKAGGGERGNPDAGAGGGGSKGKGKGKGGH